jgi:cytochrome c553
MNKKSITRAVLGIVVLMNVHLSVQAVDIEAGQEAFETCRGCHSSVGYSNVYPTYYVPKIGGQTVAYIISALKAYKESNRSHRTMMANSYHMNEKTMENIAVYLASNTNGSKTARNNHGDIAKGKALAQSCLSCHNDDKSVEAINPRLAGQHANYLEKAMQDYQSGKRKNSLMQSMVEKLSDEALHNISAYFSSLQGVSTPK